MELAEVAAKRSEDPFYKVGAVALTKEGRVIGTGYNGLPSKVDPDEGDWWNDKELRKPFIIHAEQNLCSLFKRGDAHLVAVTLMPCPDCFRALVAHGVNMVYYTTEHKASEQSRELERFFNKTALIHLP